MVHEKYLSMIRGLMPSEELSDMLVCMLTWGELEAGEMNLYPLL